MGVGVELAYNGSHTELHKHLTAVVRHNAAVIQLRQDTATMHLHGQC